ncbi:hypothetical protein HYG86_05920 [Alkalicella caledoniensis]|uniref:Uncharacterized protein n=1 Tax=Alkalicella caledoniensis TaxID=2731377 RepID=A0A7G9W6N0_ALKCA|nr:hypothetical protein [Alkalicella caledoniensis]QNO14342.1 hypothetical protein HYG86_05920 [Alkalicella caledoniensis]
MKKKVLLISFLSLILVVGILGVVYKGLLYQNDFKNIELRVRNVDKEITAYKKYIEDGQQTDEHNFLNFELETIAIDATNTELELIYTNKKLKNYSINRIILKDNEPLILLMDGNKLTLPNDLGTYTIILAITNFETNEMVKFGFNVIVN